MTTMNIFPQCLGEGWNFSVHVCVEQMNLRILYSSGLQHVFK